jgi:histidinol dehydrogenase
VTAVSESRDARSSDTVSVRTLDSTTAGFDEVFDALLATIGEAGRDVERRVAEILDRVRREGDAALLELTARFDGLDLGSGADLEVPRARLEAALESIPRARRDALETAVSRVRRYHEHQRQESWSFEDEDGVFLGQQITALDRAGLYVPGGKAA